MTYFTIPHEADVPGLEPMSEWYDTDVEILKSGILRRGVKAGASGELEVTPNSGMILNVAGGTVLWDEAEGAHTAGTVTVPTANGTNPRIDVVSVTNAGVRAITAGTAAANPRPPALPANSVGAAFIWVPALDTVIASSQIFDKRILVKPLAVAGLNMVVKLANEVVNNSTTLQNDNHLSFPISATSGQAYPFELGLLIASAAGTDEFKCGWSLPSGATLRWMPASDASTPSAGQWGRRQENAQIEGTTIVRLMNNAADEAIWIKGWVISGGTSGTAQFQWAQNVAVVGDLTLKRGSYLSWAAA